jgi:hypothetical protein
MKRKALAVAVPALVAAGVILGFASSSGGSQESDLTKDPAPASAKVVVASGKTSQGGYEVRGYTNDKGEVCFDIQYEADQPPHYACGPRAGKDHPLGPLVISEAPGGGEVVYGGVAVNVATVDVAVPGHGHAHPKATDVPGIGRVFATEAAPARGVTVTAEDASGAPVAAAPRTDGAPAANSAGGQPGDG